MENEMFVEVVGYPGYFISNLGNMWGPGRWAGMTDLKPRINRHGYAQVSLVKDGKHITRLVHRLMAESFMGRADMDINHENGIKSDNRLENLKYCTRSENIHHSYRMGLAKKPQGPNHKPRTPCLNFDGPGPKAKITRGQYEQLMALKGTMAYKKAGQLFGISASTVMKYWNPEV